MPSFVIEFTNGITLTGTMLQMEYTRDTGMPSPNTLSVTLSGLELQGVSIPGQPYSISQIVAALGGDPDAVRFLREAEAEQSATPAAVLEWPENSAKEILADYESCQERLKIMAADLERVTRQRDVMAANNTDAVRQIECCHDKLGETRTELADYQERVKSLHDTIVAQGERVKRQHDTIIYDGQRRERLEAEIAHLKRELDEERAKRTMQNGVKYMWVVEDHYHTLELKAMAADRLDRLRHSVAGQLDDLAEELRDG